MLLVTVNSTLVLDQDTVLNVLVSESMPQNVFAHTELMMMVVNVSLVHLNVNLVIKIPMVKLCAQNVLKTELLLMKSVSVLMVCGITQVNVKLVDTHVKLVLTNGLVLNVTILEDQLMNVHVHMDTTNYLDLQNVMLVHSDVPFVKEMLITVLNVLILD